MEKEQDQKSLEFWIYNETRNTSLEYHRLDSEDHSPPHLNLMLPSANRDCSQIFRDDESPETKRLVVYEANSFTLAIFVHICWKKAKMLQLELSQDKAHVGEGGELDGTFSRMSRMLNPPDANRTAVSRCKLHGRGKVSTWLISGPYKVTATLSHSKKTLLVMHLEEQEMN